MTEKKAVKKPEPTFYQKVAKVQRELKAPKSQVNTFGNYKYRNCEDILKGFNDVAGDLILIVGDELVEFGGLSYIKATATITDGENTISNSAYACNPVNKKGMDPSQVTGATSSYARKYALNGLLCIDDTKDADSHDNSKAEPVQQNQQAEKPWFNEDDLKELVCGPHGAYSAFMAGEVDINAVIAWIRQSYKVSRQMGEKIKGLAK